MACVVSVMCHVSLLGSVLCGGTLLCYQLEQYILALETVVSSVYMQW